MTPVWVMHPLRRLRLKRAMRRKLADINAALQSGWLSPDEVEALLRLPTLPPRGTA